MSSRPRRDSDADARAPASPRPMPLTGSGNGPAGLSPSPGGAAAGVTSRRTLGRKAQAPRVPTKAQQAVDKLLDKIRTNADQTPSAAKKETERGEAKRDANGRFAKRTRPGPGRPPVSRNKISKAFKEVPSQTPYPRPASRARGLSARRGPPLLGGPAGAGWSSSRTEATPPSSCSSASWRVGRSSCAGSMVGGESPRYSASTRRWRHDGSPVRSGGQMAAKRSYRKGMV